MNDEQDRNSEAVAKLAKRQNQTDQTAQAIRNVAKVGKLAPEAVGTGIKIAKGVDDLSGGALSQTAAKAINRIPGGKLAGKVAGNKLATGASNLVSLKKDNPSLDGFSKIKGNKTSSDNKEKDNNKGKTVGGYIPVDNKSESSSNSYLGSSSLSAFIEKSPFIAKIMVMVFIVGVIFIIVFASIYATIHEQEEKLKAMVISDVAEKVTKSSTIGSPAIVPVTMFFTIKDIYNNVNNLKIFNKEKPTVDSDGIASTRDSSTFGDYLESLMGKYPDEIVKAFYQLGSIFVPEGSGCNGSDCSNNPEVAFYQKITDISYRYKKLYNIELDWPLLTATILVKDKDMEEIFSSNLNSYTSRELNNLKETMSLDWDFDYKKIPGYDYLSGGDSRYDLQILAKNMVTKKTVQTCTIDSTVSKKTELVDVEDYLIEEEKELVEATAVGERKNLTLEYYLLCDGNQKYNISSTYTLDKDKYDEFLDEYLETKYYIKKSSYSYNNSDYETIPYGTDLSSTMVNVASSQIGIKGDGASKFWKPYFNQKVGWCGCFVTWVIKNTEYNGVHLYGDVIKQTSYPGSPEAYMKYFYDSADPNIQFHYNGFAPKWSSYGPKYTPKPGDLIFFNWYGTWSGNMEDIVPGSGKTSHIGIVKSVNGSTIYTIEGNTGHSEVKEQVRNLNSNDVIGFGSWY